MQALTVRPSRAHETLQLGLPHRHTTCAFRRVPHFLSYPTAANWKFLIIFQQGVLHSLFTGPHKWCSQVSPVLGFLDIKFTYTSHLTGKDFNAGKDRRQKETQAAVHEMVRQHHRINRHEFEQTWGDNGRQRSRASCSPWGRKESDTIQRLNNNKQLVPNNFVPPNVYLFQICYFLPTIVNITVR